MAALIDTLKDLIRPPAAGLSRRMARLAGSAQRIAELEERCVRLEAEVHRIGQSREQQRQLIDELQEELRETMSLHEQLAELADIMGEILIPVADRDDERVREALEKYAEATF